MEMNLNEQFADKLVELCLYLREMQEEGTQGDTRAIKLLSPWKIGSTQIRKKIINDSFPKNGMELAQTCLELSEWRHEALAQSFDSISEVRSEIVRLCSVLGGMLERKVVVPQELLVRAYRRLARHLKRVQEGKAAAHSRMFEFFVPMDWLPRAKAYAGGGHVEHVIPCVYLRDEAIRMYERGADCEEVAQMLRRFLVVADIPKTKQELLDKSARNGGLGLKVSMPMTPNPWSFTDGCTFARLHSAEVEFEEPRPFPEGHFLHGVPWPQGAYRCWCMHREVAFHPSMA